MFHESSDIDRRRDAGTPEIEARGKTSIRAKNGRSVIFRFVDQADRGELQNYIRSLSERSRYNRFLSALSELPASQLDRFIDTGRDGRFTIVATVKAERRETIVGEACYALVDGSSVDCSLSIGDEWQELGIGTSLMRSVECRAVLLGAERLYGDVLRSNKFMLRLARKCSCEVSSSPIDWRLVRCQKRIGAVLSRVEP